MTTADLLKDIVSIGLLVTIIVVAYFVTKETRR